LYSVRCLTLWDNITVITVTEWFNSPTLYVYSWGKIGQPIPKYRGRSLLLISKGTDHLLSTSQKEGLTSLFKKFLFMSTIAISKPVFQEIGGTVIAFPADNIKTLFMLSVIQLSGVHSILWLWNHLWVSYWQHVKPVVRYKQVLGWFHPHQFFFILLQSIFRFECQIFKN